MEKFSNKQQKATQIQTRSKSMKYDVVIVGSGIAGLYCALHLPQSMKVLLVCKEEAKECNTFYAQGGISVAVNEEDVRHHIEDTLSAGSFANDSHSVEILSLESLRVVEDLEKFGIFVDRNPNGEILYTQEGGHKRARIVHFNGDGSGEFVHTHLLKLLAHPLMQNAQVVNLLIEGGDCYGVVVDLQGEQIPIYANHIVLASGGIGGLYTYHTNARTLSADLHGMILEHQLRLKDMEMMQFHPTAYVQAPMARKPLISEAVRGEGGTIVDTEGRRFLFDYDVRGELAPRDIVARGIFDYCMQNQEQAFLDLSSFSHSAFKERFPNIYLTLQSFGVDVPRQKVPIAPAFHYCMGGIEVDKQSRVVGIKNLYAIGECASNGIHGANRLASNSLLEGLVFGKRVAQEISNSLNTSLQQKVFYPQNVLPLHHQNDQRFKTKLRQVMWENVGIIRTQVGLTRALEEVEEMMQSEVGRMFYLRLRVAREIILQALGRKQSLGAHFIKQD